MFSNQNGMKRREFLRAGIATSLLSMLPKGGLFAETSATAARPNVLILFSDQHHAGMTGYAGHPNLHTPCLDRLAASGTRFDRAYCQDGVCCPSRTSMFTGQYPRTLGLYDNDLKSNSAFSKLTPMQRAFHQAGYYTFTTGKRHLVLPADSDWDYSAGTQNLPTEMNRDTLHYWNWIKQKGLSDQLKKDWDAEFGGPNEAPMFTCRLSALPPEATAEAFAAWQTIEFLKSDKAKKKPFFAWSTFYRPHQPYTPQKSYADQIDFSALKLPSTLWQNSSELPPGLRDFRNRKSGNPWNLGMANEEDYRRYIGYYIALVHEIDDHIHSILDVLEKEGLADNTIIVYTSDHGDFVGNHGLVEKGAPWHNFYEETLRVPFLIKWPGKIPSGTIRKDLVELVDIYPTLLGLCGIDPPKDFPLAGRNLTETLLRQAPVDRKYAVSENWSQASIITDNFKYGQWLTPPDPKVDYRSWGNMLVERSSDPNEINNLVKNPAHAEKLKEMEGYLAEWIDKTDDSGRREFFDKQKVPYSKV